MRDAQGAVPGGQQAGHDPEGTPKSQSDQQASGRLVRLQIPLARPLVTYIVLGVLAAVFVAQTVFGGSTNTAALVQLGAQVNTLVAEGQLWRLVTAMFLHIGVQHIAFNAWALFSVGREVETLYGSPRFALLYLVTGLAGNIAYYLLGGQGLSAGASGAVFGTIGAEVAYFLLNRKLFGTVGRQRLGNLAVLIGINLVFGFTIPGINNLAHLGGLLSGFLLGLGLAPRFGVEPGSMFDATAPRVVDQRTLAVRVVSAVVAVVLLLGGLQLGNQRWQGSSDLLRQQAQEKYDAGDYASAQTLLEQAVATDPHDQLNLLNLGVVYLVLEQPARAVPVLEQARDIDATDLNTLFTLGVAYANVGRNNEAVTILNEFLAREPTGERASYARRVLTEVQAN